MSDSDPATGALGRFRAFERAGWAAIVEPFDAYLGPLTNQAVPALLDAAGVGPGCAVLDEASGLGNAAAAAARRGATVIAGDVSPEMVAAARRRYPRLHVREADAEALPFADGVFDVVLMNFGIMHVGRPERALAEARRVARPGGRFAFTAWAAPSRSPGFGIVLRALQAHGTTDGPLPPGPDFFRFGDPDECTRALREAGFHAPRAAVLHLDWALPGPDALLDAMLHGTVRTAALLRAQPAEALAAIRVSVRAGAAAYQTNGGVAIPMGVVVARGITPETEVGKGGSP